MERTILVAVEDNSLSGLMRRRLVNSGYQAITANSQQTVLDVLSKRSVDLMLIEVRLYEQLSKSKKYVKQMQAPYKLITGYTDEKRAAKLSKRGANGYFLLDDRFLSAFPEQLNERFRVHETEKKPSVSHVVSKESENTLKSILASLKDPAYICSANHVLQYANPELKALIGSRLLDNKCYAAIFSNSSSCTHCPSINSLQTESYTSQIEMVVGEENRFFQVSITPIQFENGSISRLHILKDVTDLIQAKKQAEYNEQKFKMVADNAIDMVWQMDIRLKFTYLSPSAETILGYSMEQMIGRNLWEFARRKDFMVMARYALGAMKNYKNFTHTTFITRLLHKSGTEVPVEITGKLLKDKQGKIVGLQGSTKDITERFRNQSELQKQHRLLRTLVDNIPDVIYVKDLSNRYLLNNIAHQKELKVRSQEEILHKSDHSFYDDDTVAEYLRDEQKIIESGIPMINKEEYLALQNGHEKWKLTTKVPIRDEHGTVTGIAGIKRDITNRKSIEDELLKSRHELALRNRIANAFLTADSDKLYQNILNIILAEFHSSSGYFGYVNEKMELVCPSMSEEIMDECKLEDHSLIIPHSSWKGIWGRSLLEKKVLYANEDLNLPMGHISIKNVLCLPITIKGDLLGQICLANKPGGYNKSDVQVLENIGNYLAPILHSYLKEEQLKTAKEEAFALLQSAKEKAEESDQLKSAFLLNLSHELRTPLNAIMGFTNVLDEQLKDMENGEFFATQISSAGNDLMKMIDDTIAMAKLESGQIDVDPVRQKLETTLREIQVEFQKKYLKNNPDIEFHLVDRSNEIVLNTDHRILKRALNNLLDNAVKYSEKGKVELGAHQINGSRVIVYVKDMGIGIAEEHLEQVFEKFRKIEGKQKFYRGNGLGLSITKGFVEIIGGSIEIESTPGTGTIVSISLPVKIDMQVEDSEIAKSRSEN